MTEDLTGREAIEVVYADLEQIAETHGDVTPDIYKRFFALSEEGFALMGHSDEHMQGRMFEQVVELLLDDRHLEPEGYLQWELENHLDAYGATPNMYRAFFAAINDVAKDCLGDDWNDAHNAAWQQRTDAILHMVDNYEASAGQSASM